MDIEEAREESQDATFLGLAGYIDRLEMRIKSLEKRIERLEAQAMPSVDECCNEVSKRMMRAMRTRGVAL